MTTTEIGSVAAALRRDGKDLNLINLHRLDPGVDSVLYTASFVVLYVLQEATMTWIRRDTEGSMFWVRRSSMPWQRLVVLNRLNSTNLNEDLDRSMEIDFQFPYTFYRSIKGEVVAIWFSQAQDFQGFQEQWQMYITSKPISVARLNSPHTTPDSLKSPRSSLSWASPQQPFFSPASAVSPNPSRQLPKEKLISPDMLLKSPATPVLLAAKPNPPNKKILSRSQFEQSLRALLDKDEFIERLYGIYCNHRQKSSLP